MPANPSLGQAQHLLSTWQLVLALAGPVALLLLLQDRRASLIPLLAQYVFVSLLLGGRLPSPLVPVRIGLGISICLILFVSAAHVERELAQVARIRVGSTGSDERPSARQIQEMVRDRMGPTFRLMLVGLAGLAAYGMWRGLPLAGIPQEVSLAGYLLIWTGLLISLTSMDPLRTGIGLLVILSGFEAIYLLLEKSYLVMGLLGASNILVALAVSVCAESWLESLRAEVAA